VADDTYTTVVVVFAAAAAASSSSKGQDDPSEVVVSYQDRGIILTKTVERYVLVSEAHSNRGEIDPATYT